MCVTLSLPGVLRQHAGGCGRVPLEIGEPATVASLLDRLGAELPALERRVRDETGALRRHVNVFVGEVDVRADAGLATALTDGAEVVIVPAVSGG